jgi:hypothetical protein
MACRDNAWAPRAWDCEGVPTEGEREGRDRAGMGEGAMCADAGSCPPLTGAGVDVVVVLPKRAEYACPCEGCLRVSVDSRVSTEAGRARGERAIPREPDCWRSRLCRRSSTVSATLDRRAGGVFMLLASWSGTSLAGRLAPNVIPGGVWCRV